MRRTDYRALVDRGRKAGLGTADIYGAMAALRPEAGDVALGVADGNGFVAYFDGQGRCVFRPDRAANNP